MKTRLPLGCIAAMAVMALCSWAIVRAEETYSGIAKVEDLGVIAFPIGKWSLEMRALRTAPEALKEPDYFVFKKLDSPPERLTFLRYNPMIAPKDAAACERAVDGFSRLSLSTEEKRMDAEVATLQFQGRPAKVTWRTSFSWVRVPRAPEPRWLYHAGLYSSENNWAIGVIRASTANTDPRTIENVYELSRFLKRLPEKMHLIPQELVGDWRWVSEDRLRTDVLHLRGNGECAIASGSFGESISFGSVGYYVEEDRTLGLGKERFRYDGKTLTRISEKDSQSDGAKIYARSNSPERFWHGFDGAPRMINDGNTLKYGEVEMR